MHGHRHQLWSLRRRVLELAATVRGEEKLQAASIDALLDCGGDSRDSSAAQSDR